MDPIPVYARVLGTFLGIVAVPMLVFGVLAGTSSVLATTAQVHRTATYDVGDAPLLRLDVQHGDVVVEAGADGRIVVDYEHSASSITRAAAGWAVNQARVSISHEANDVSVQETSSLNPIVPLNRSAELRVQVPARTDLDITCFGNLTVGRLDGNFRIRGRQGTTLRHVSLRNSFDQRRRAWYGPARRCHRVWHGKREVAGRGHPLLWLARAGSQRAEYRRRPAEQRLDHPPGSDRRTRDRRDQHRKLEGRPGLALQPHRGSLDKHMERRPQRKPQQRHQRDHGPGEHQLRGR